MEQAGAGKPGIAWRPGGRAHSRTRGCAREGTESIAGVFELGTRALWAEWMVTTAPRIPIIIPESPTLEARPWSEISTHPPAEVHPWYDDGGGCRC